MQCKLEVLHSNYLTICTFGLDCNFIMAITNNGARESEIETETETKSVSGSERLTTFVEEEPEKEILGK